MEKEYIYKIINRYLKKARETASRVDSSECIESIRFVEYIVNQFRSDNLQTKTTEEDLLNRFRNEKHS